MDFSGAPDGPALRLLVLHDDGEREFDYTAGAEDVAEHAPGPGLDRGQHEGRLDHGLRVTVTTTITGDLVRVGAQTFTLGSDRPLPGGGARAARRRRRLRDRAPPGHQRAVRRVRPGHALRHGGRTPPRPGRLPRRPAGEPAARLDGLHPDRRPRRPTTPRAVVDVDARRALAPPRGPRLVAGRAGRPPRRPRRPRGRRGLRRVGRPGAADRGRVGGRRPRRARRRRYTWGDDPEARGERRANFWHGAFPWRADPGYGRTARSGRSPPTPTACSTWPATSGSGRRTGTPSRAAADAPCCVPSDPRGPADDASYDPQQPQFAVPRKVVKGGSFLCADSYCRRYRPAARRPQTVDTGMSHIGFRCVVRAGPTLAA